MSSLRSIILAGGLAALAQAFTPPTSATWGPLLTPDLSSPVTQGQTYTVTWDPETHATDGVTVSLVLCHGPSTNCVTASSAIVEGVPAAAKSYSWSVPCSLAAGTQATDTGYGMLIIVDGTGEFQYSTQFSVLSSPSCGSSSSTPSSPPSSAVSPVTISTSSYSRGGYGAWNTTSTTSTSETDTMPISSIVYATGSPTTSKLYTTAAVTSYASAAPATPAASVSSFPGAAGRVESQTAGIIGAVVGGIIAFFAL